MIELEGPLFTIIANALRDRFSGIFVSGEYVPIPASFPAVSVVEADNATYAQTRTSSNVEYHAQVMYEVDVYSNRAKGKKTEAKAIISVIDEIFLRYGFTRMFCEATPNMNDATIYRMTARYRAIVDQNLTIYRR